MYHLSKSRIISYLQCPKRLWLQVHKPDEAEMSEPSVKAISFGYEVGEIAQRLYPEGQLAGTYDDLKSALKTTERLLENSSDAVLFEAAFSSEGILILADIIEKRKGNLYLIEVKSSTSIKDYQVNDAAIQAWVMLSAGREPKNVFIRHINNEFIYPGDNNYIGLFSDEDITDRANEIAREIPSWIKQCLKVLQGEEPEIKTGDQCEDPFSCEYATYCTRNLPPESEYPVTILPRGRVVAEKLVSLGYSDLRDVPENMLLNENHLRVWNATKSGRAIIDQDVRKILREYGYPRYFLDFEGINFAVPIWKGTRPYQQVPFQYSCHVMHAEGELKHHSYLHTTQESPIRTIVSDLIARVGKDGPIFVYNQAYEKTVLTQMAELLPDLSDDIECIINRIVDLLPITRTHYYHPQMKGSWSIKAVLPTIAPELDYDNLDEVADGSSAQDAFVEIISPETAAERKEELIGRLLKYCERDTLALVAIVDFFEKG